MVNDHDNSNFMVIIIKIIIIVIILIIIAKIMYFFSQMASILPCEWFYVGFCDFHCYKDIPTNHPDFIGTVPIFGFQDIQKLGHSDFLELQPANIPVFKIIFETKISIFRGLFSKLRRTFLYRSEPYI